jgi:hypothetical protein
LCANVNSRILAFGPNAPEIVYTVTASPPGASAPSAILAQAQIFIDTTAPILVAPSDPALPQAQALLSALLLLITR